MFYVTAYIASFTGIVGNSLFWEIFETHHHQGIILSAYFKPRIDFEKTYGMDRFCNSITKVRFQCPVLVP